MTTFFQALGSELPTDTDKTNRRSESKITPEITNIANIILISMLHIFIHEVWRGGCWFSFADNFINITVTYGQSKC